VSRDEKHAFAAWYRGDKEPFLKDFNEAYQETVAEVRPYFDKKRSQSPFHILSAYLAMTAYSKLLYERAKGYFDAETMNFMDKWVHIDLFDEATRMAWKKWLASRKEDFGVKQT